MFNLYKKINVKTLGSVTVSYEKFYHLSVVSAARKTPTTTTASCPPADTKCDAISPPHDISNLRSVRFCIPQDEAPIERQFRLRRQEVQEWNQEFWAAHNTKFIKERKEFMAANQPQNSDQPLTADEMSVFYKSFLDKNWRTHLVYNFEWYKKNIHLVLLHLRVKIHQTLRRPKGQS